MAAPAAVRTPPYLVDIAANLTDSVFRGFDWKGNRIHDDDLDCVLARAQEKNVQQIIITGTSLAQSVKAIAMCRRYPDRRLLCTVGVHPAHCAEFLRPLDLDEVRRVAESDTSMVKAHHQDQPSGEAAASSEQVAAWSEERLAYLVDLVRSNRDVVVAVGEIGIDYAELMCCPREVQKRFFARQLAAFAPLQLPFLFHSRECGMMFVSHLQQTWAQTAAAAAPLCGVVHSFNGTLEEQTTLLAMGLHLSVNASAFREEGLARQVTGIPLDRLLLETDAPWCDVRPKDFGASFVRNAFQTTKRKKPFEMGACLERRNEPCHLVQVVEEYLGTARAVAAESSDAPAAVDEAALVSAVYDNCKRIFAL